MLWREFSTPRWARRSLVRELDELQREMNRLMGDGWRASTNFPPMNVWAGEDSLVVVAELPGVKPEDIDISVDGDTLTLSGLRQTQEFEEEQRYHRRERTHGSFNRTLQVPFRAEAERVEASFKDGVLSITVPRAESDKPRKVEVKSS